MIISQPLTTGHPCVRFIKEQDYPFDMVELQTNLNNFRYHFDSDVTSERNVTQPLNQVAKKICKCGCGQEIKFRKSHIKRSISFIKGHHSKSKKVSERIKLLNKINPMWNITIRKKVSETMMNKHIEKYKDIVINEEAEQILIGSLLGDGHLANRKIMPEYMASYHAVHCYKQLEYLKWKKDILNLPLVRNQIYIKKIKVANTNYTQCFFLTKKLPQLKKYYDLFYPNGKKIVTREILDNLKPIGIAVWYMDDGYYSYGTNNMTIFTDGFTVNENVLIKEWFKEKYNLNFVIDKVKRTGNYRLRLNSKEAKKFVKLIKPYILPYFNYKLGLDIHRQNNSKQKIKENSKKYYIKNKERISKQCMEWRKNNREYIINYNQNYYQQNKIKLLNNSKKYHFQEETNKII